MWTKKLELGSYESIDDIDTPKFFNPMLAHKFEDYKDKITYPVYSQPKLDGIRCIVRADGMLKARKENVIRDVTNVVEDSRIERKIKHKYPGLKNSFVKAYGELMDRDFFGIKDVEEGI